MAVGKKPLDMGPTRSLTAMFVKAREDHRSKRMGRFGPRRDPTEVHQRLLTPSSPDEMVAMPPAWVATLAEGQEVLAAIRDRVEALERVQKKRMQDVFNAQDRDAEIDDLSSTIAGLIKRCEACVQQMSGRNNGAGTKREAKVRENAQCALAQALQESSKQFRKQQKSFVATIEKRDGGPAWLELGDSNEPIDDFGFTDTQLIELEERESEVDNRSEQITKIAKSVTELNSIFKELAVLVIDQGTVLDRIDYNLEQVSVKTQEATKQLEKADKAQRSGRAMKCIMALIIGIFILIVIITFQHRKPRST
jgi:syntaxin 16